VFSIHLASDHRAEREAAIAVARFALGDQAFAAVWAEGQAMTLEQAVAYAVGQDCSDG
jgi:hypothetical protein